MNVKNWLIKILVIKNLFRILVTVIGNVINQFDGGEYLDLENCKCKKKKVNKLLGEWSGNIDGNE